MVSVTDAPAAPVAWVRRVTIAPGGERNTARKCPAEVLVPRAACQVLPLSNDTCNGDGGGGHGRDSHPPDRCRLSGSPTTGHPVPGQRAPVPRLRPAGHGRWPPSGRRPAPPSTRESP